MNKQDVRVFFKQNDYQRELMAKGHRRIWEAVDKSDIEPLFQSPDLDKVLAWVQENPEQVDYVTSFVEER